ncbi:hypothetical protein GYMLUDRAFT_244605 [Collybiopsis luxurians FD-317 M1]|uniref:Integrase core domain-containing protein n=1 Tax=Collybiopsis luxurians FD-317 M1 TaxID=944289 RepID=A0A0D0CCC8_9AGAR|nr:hypothetical protein GYMLUDRAFT_244605 [Collybiopsis luxurians FD-317 M1]
MVDRRLSMLNTLGNWARTHHTTSALSHFLDVPRRTIRQRLLELGLATPGENPFPSSTRPVSDEDDHILDGLQQEPSQLPEAVQVEAASIPSSSSGQSGMTDTQLDSLLTQLRAHYDQFIILELHHGLQISNINHIWLLQHLFLPVINEELAFWAESWNHHCISQCNGPARSPEDRFGFDMLVNGHRGDPVDQYTMTDEELEVFGVDWEGLQDEDLLWSLQKNYCNEGAGSWLGRNGPPLDLNDVSVDTPAGPLTQPQVDYLDTLLHGHSRQPRHEDVLRLWIDALAIVRTMYPHDF